jgi:hypothetical protein
VLWLLECVPWRRGASAYLMMGVTTGGLHALCPAAAPALREEFGRVAAPAFFLAGLLITYVLAVAAHEAGHAVGAAWAGLSVRCARVGPFGFARRGRRWVARWDGWHPQVEGWIDCCGLELASCRHAAVMLLAGPMASLVLGVAAAVLAGGGLHPLPGCWLGMFAVQSLLFGVVNLVPDRAGEFESDGLALWRLLRGGKLTNAEHPVASGSSRFAS